MVPHGLTVPNVVVSFRAAGRYWVGVCWMEGEGSERVAAANHRQEEERVQTSDGREVQPGLCCIWSSLFSRICCRFQGKLEALYETAPCVGDICIHGEPSENYVIAIVVPKKAWLAQWARWLLNLCAVMLTRCADAMALMMRSSTLQTHHQR